MTDYFIYYVVSASALTFIATLIFIPLIILRIPENYFKEQLPPKSERWNIPVYARISFLILKNILGIILFLGGFVMLFTPGQGLLTMLIGLSLTNFPGKRTLERKLVSNEKVFKSINWIRKKNGVSPIQKPCFK